ncbi:MAG: 1-acyl-sn-glycerol-3-phosphate acyltransferase [Spirochaetes bacterium]|nr:1-acyl-sn-glycerol-3-phosphate acyltransferase [Spirochaetota bacterium]
MEKITDLYLGRRNRLVFYFTVYLLRIWFFFKYKIKIEGAERIPRDSAFVLLPKHQRWTDIPLVAWAAPRSMYYVAKHELFLTRFTSRYISALGGLPLNRERPIESRNSLLKVIDLLNQGEGVVVFPEGTYYENRMGPGNIGVVRLILSKVSFPFIPVGINYSRGRFRTKVKISFGRPLVLKRDETTGRPIDTPEDFLKIAMKEIARLSNLG